MNNGEQLPLPDTDETSPAKNDSFRWKRFLRGLAIAFALTLAFIAFSVFNTWRKIPESYAAWTTGNLIVDYLNTHSNQWPRSWEDLNQATNCQRYIHIPELREKVKVDWQADIRVVLETFSNNLPASVLLVTRPDGSKLHAIWGRDTDPNVKIIGYLISTRTQSNASSSGAIAN